MRNISLSALPLLALAAALAACSPQNESSEANTVAPTATEVAPENAVMTNGTEAMPTPTASPSAAAANVLALEGLGALRIGEAVPKGSGWTERGAQASDTCRTVTSPDYPGVYAIVEGDKVRRITVGKRSDVKLVEGIGVGAREAEVQKWFAGFRAEPHKYVEAPAKYLTAPNAASGDPALRFEINKDGTVSAIHVGTMPVLGYVEGCS